jgi:hypothetical protein
VATGGWDRQVLAQRHRLPGPCLGPGQLLSSGGWKRQGRAQIRKSLSSDKGQPMGGDCVRNQTWPGHVLGASINHRRQGKESEGS